LFSNKRYLTCGVDAEIPPLLQVLLWQLIDLRKPNPLDYLQVFKLTIENGLQIITHAQKQPPHLQAIICHTDEPVEAKIYVIDDGENSTMLLASEY
jgi:hypothetical protein